MNVIPSEVEGSAPGPGSACCQARPTELPFDLLDLDAAEVRARFVRARQSGHPTWLWPEVAVDDWHSALAAIESATRACLAGDTPTPELRGNLDALGTAAYTSGMGPLLGYWLERGSVTANPSVAALLGLHLRHNRLRMERLGAEAKRVIELLGEVGIVPTVLKGMHTAHTYFPEAGTRSLCDIDLLLQPDELDRAERAFRQGGYLPRGVQRRPYKCDWVAVGSPDLPRSLSLTHAEDPFSFDVHTSPDRNFFGVGTVRLRRVAHGSTGGPWSVATPATTLGQPALTLLLAAHASEGLHSLSLLRIVELVLVIRQDASSGVLDWDELRRAATLAGALRFAYPALELAERLTPGTIPATALNGFRSAATRSMRRVIDRLTPATAQRLDRKSLEESFMWAGSPWEHARRAAFALWPAPAGRSLAELGLIYRRRAWRLIQGTVDR